MRQRSVIQRVIALGLLINQVACYSWQTQHHSPADVLTTRKPDAVRLVRRTGEETTLGNPRLEGDSMIGNWLGGSRPTMRMAVAAKDVLAADITLVSGLRLDVALPVTAGDTLVGEVLERDLTSRHARIPLDEVRLARLRVTGRQVIELRAPRMEGDSLVGQAPRLGNESPRMAVALADIETVQVNDFNLGETLGIVIPVVLVAGAIIAVVTVNSQLQGCCAFGASRSSAPGGSR